MSRRQFISLGRILGIPVGLDLSWFLIVILITWTMAVAYYPSAYPHWSPATYWFTGAATALLLFISVLLHELGHSIVARRYAIPVRRITLFIFGGVAEIQREPPSAGAEFWIAIAGPIVSFLLAGLFGLLATFWPRGGPLFALFIYLAYLNGALAVFNLIPGFPLDGGRVLRAILWGTTGSFHQATLYASMVGRGIAWLFIFLGVWQLLGGNVINGLWIAFIGWFLDSAAAAQLQQQAIHELLAGHTVAQAMSRNVQTVPPDMTVEELVDQHIIGQGRRAVVVVQQGEVQGLVTLHHLSQIPRSEWPRETVAQIMIPKEQLQYAHPNDDLWETLEKMGQAGVGQLPVLMDGRLQGMLSRSDIIAYMQTLRTLGVSPGTSAGHSAAG
ncbi:MAG: peptidase M50 [Litorilinea sp.]|nr:MAG: peptidase M50 [Litorilinea sp.]